MSLKIFGFVKSPFLAFLHSFLQDYNVRIRVPPPSVMTDEVVVSGERDGVAVAVAKLLDIYRAKVSYCNVGFPFLFVIKLSSIGLI